MPELYGVWITDRDGSSPGRWMSDSNNGKKVWSGSFEAASFAIEERQQLYRHLIYEVKEVTEEPE